MLVCRLAEWAVSTDTESPRYCSGFRTRGIAMRSSV
jgi:hypothetical protein